MVVHPILLLFDHDQHQFLPDKQYDEVTYDLLHQMLSVGLKVYECTSDKWSSLCVKTHVVSVPSNVHMSKCEYINSVVKWV